MSAPLPWKLYKRVGEIEARPWTAEEANRYQFGGTLGLNDISVSKEDHYAACHPTGMVARNPSNPDDQWYIHPIYFAKHYAEVTEQLSALSAREKVLREALALDEPWPLRDVLDKLRAATAHLLDAHACDAHWHEEYRTAQMQAETIIARLDIALSALSTGEAK